MKNITKLTTALLSSALSLTLIGCSTNSTTYNAGTYTGEGTGKNGTVKVEVTFTEDAIESVTVTENSETPDIAKAAIDTIPEKIVASQSANVDTVSGATLTSNAIIDGVKDAIQQAGGDPETSGTQSSVVAQDEEVSTDVVVIGAGAAGSSAALAALQNGSKVILLEKTASPMGAGTLAGGMFAADSQLQKDANAEVDKEWLYEQYMDASEGYMDSVLVRKIIDEAGNTVDWLMENGMELNLVDAGTGGAYEHIDMPATLHGYNEGGTVALTKLIGEFENQGGEVRWSTPATELIVEDGAVTGVVATKEDGGKLTIHANSVVIATGGYGGNEEMLKEYVGENYTMGEVLQNTGDGIQMAWAAGADENGIGVQHYFWETLKGEEIGALSEVVGDDWFSLTDWTAFPNLRVNKFGERFSNETDVTLYSVHGAEIAMQPGQMEYVIIDSKTLADVAENGTYILEDQYAKWVDDRQFYMEFNEDNDTDALYAAQHTPTDYRPLLDSCLDLGVVFKADTIEELAEQLDMDTETLQASINQYNTAIETGEDTQYFADTDRLIPVQEGPYYAIKFVARNLSTLGGIRINSNMEVLDANANPIAGLYAAGADAGGMYGKAYVDFEGGTLGFAYTSGRLAGLSASQK